MFHIRKDKFDAGYLGVDIFFLISGYLMCMLLSRHEQLSLTNIIDFYYRRIKRIFPIYFFVIFVVQITAFYYWLYPLEYNLLVMQTVKPLLFIENQHEITDANYFKEVNRIVFCVYLSYYY